MATATALALALVLAGQASAAPPTNDPIANAQFLSPIYPASIDGTTVESTLEAGEDEIEPEGASGTVWFRLNPVVPMEITLDTCTSQSDTTLTVYTGTSIAGLNVVESADTGCGSGDGARLTFMAGTGTGTGYAISVGSGCSACEGTFTLRATVPIPSNDAFAAAVALAATLPTRIEGTTIGATLEEGEEPDPQDSSGSVWYAWIADANRRVRLDTCETLDPLSDTTITVYTGSSVQSLVPLVSNDDGCGSESVGSALEFDAVQGTAYRIGIGALCQTVCEGPFALRATTNSASTPSPIEPASPKCKKGQKLKKGKCVKKKKPRKKRKK